MRDSNVGYIDSAIPGDQVRLRFDFTDNNRRPNRAEFFYARGRPFGPGLSLPESTIDNQDLTAAVETALGPCFSAFVELPWRFLNPERNANVNGLADMNVGGKYAFVAGPDLVASLQLRTYIPSGDATRGLGTNHASLEPAFLVFSRLNDRCNLESELRYWVPLGGTDFAGDIIRYGIGVNYELAQTTHLRFIPLVEFIGWTVLGGKETLVAPSGQTFVQGAAGDTILNAKVGVHVKVGHSADIYAGYGRPLTGERWYESIYRLEFRLFF
ncbi:MAG: hypothetical protein L0Z62_33535 [Gemmataceae bacterium]|nr:hypothetical protein [Gemmataceae bacterium]